MIATRIATSSDHSAATWALSFSPPSRTNSVMSGRAAKIVDRHSELPTGSSTCLYMRILPPEELDCGCHTPDSRR